jgi:hypothetical protein
LNLVLNWATLLSARVIRLGCLDLLFPVALTSLIIIKMATPKKKLPPMAAVAMRHVSWLLMPLARLLMLTAVKPIEIK